jgi:hypothetical protein
MAPTSDPLLLYLCLKFHSFPRTTQHVASWRCNQHGRHEKSGGILPRLEQKSNIHLKPTSIYIYLYIVYACLCHSKQIQYLQEIRFTMDDDWLQIPCFREQICFVLAKFKQLEDLEGYAPWVYLQLLVLVYLHFVCLSRLLIENVQDLAPYWVADKYSLPQHVSGRIQYRAPGRDHGRQKWWTVLGMKHLKTSVLLQSMHTLESSKLSCDTLW